MGYSNSPDIELWSSDSPYMNSSLKYVKTIKYTGNSLWENSSLDTPILLTDNIYRNSTPNGESWVYYSGKHGSKWSQFLMWEPNLTEAVSEEVFNFSVYMNNKYVGSSYYSGHINYTDANLRDGRLGIGKSRMGSANTFFNGSIDDVIYFEVEWLI